MGKAVGITKEDILDAALGLYSARGYDATNMVELAEAVGVRAATLYWHFPNKAAILEALVAPAADAVDAVLARHRGGDGKEASARSLLKDYLAALVAHRGVVGFMVGDAAVRQHPALGPRLSAQQGALQSALAGRRASAAATAAAVAAVGAVSRPVIALDEDQLSRSTETIVEAGVRALSAGMRGA